MPGFGDSLPGQTCDGRWQTLYHRAVSVNKQKQRRCESPGCSNPYPHLHTPGTVTMDFVEGLPMSRGYSCIMVVVDKLTRYAHFIPLAHPFSAIQVASIFMQQIYKHHGLPYAIVSDRDRVFTSTLWRELFKLAGTELRMSSAYHPQTDGTTERVNQCMETYLRCFVHSCPHKWFSGCTSPNFGTTLQLILLSKLLLSRYCTVTHLVTLALWMRPHQRRRTSRPGSMNVR